MIEMENFYRSLRIIQKALSDQGDTLFRESEKQKNAEVAGFIRRRSGECYDAMNQITHLVNNGSLDQYIDNAEEKEFGSDPAYCPDVSSDLEEISSTEENLNSKSFRLLQQLYDQCSNNDAIWTEVENFLLKR